MQNRVIYNVGYEIPLVRVGLPGRQNRASDGVLRITPGMTEVFEFWFGNHDGLPITLVPFQIKIVFWKNSATESEARIVGMENTEIVFSKQLDVIKPYEGKTVVILETNETMEIGRTGGANLYWSLFMINNERQIFPATCTSSGSRSGKVYLETLLPTAELVLSA